VSCPSSVVWELLLDVGIDARLCKSSCPLTVEVIISSLLDPGWGSS
jgi:hypothetical protein